MSEEEPVNLWPPTPEKIKLRNAVRHTYDLQRLRIQMALRSTPKKGYKAPPVHLDELDLKFMDASGKGMKKLEDQAKQEVTRLCEAYFPRIHQLLRSVKGIGPVGAGVFISEFNVQRAIYPSQWWAYCGLDVVDGSAPSGLGFDVIEEVFGSWERPEEHKDEEPWFGKTVVAWFKDEDDANVCRQDMNSNRIDVGPPVRFVVRRSRSAPKPVKGEKLGYNSWLRTKMLFVVGGCLLKAQNERYTQIYGNYRHRKLSQLGTCRNCNGTGTAARPKKAGARVDPQAGKPTKCWNCVGSAEGSFTPDRAPWGKSKAHRHQAALRYMVKIFIADVWHWWRTDEGLPVAGTYGEVKLGLRPHSKDPTGGKEIEDQVLEEGPPDTENDE